MCSLRGVVRPVGQGMRLKRLSRGPGRGEPVPAGSLWGGPASGRTDNDHAGQTGSVQHARAATSELGESGSRGATGTHTASLTRGVLMPNVRHIPSVLSFEGTACHGIPGYLLRGINACKQARHRVRDTLQRLPRRGEVPDDLIQRQGHFFRPGSVLQRRGLTRSRADRHDVGFLKDPARFIDSINTFHATDPP